MRATPNPPSRPLSSGAPPILGAFAILGGGQIGARLLTFAATVWLTRSLSVEGFGAIAFGLGVLVYAVFLVDFGIGYQAALEVARDESAAPELAGAAVLARLGLVVPAGIALVVFSLAAPLEPAARTTSLLYALALLPAALHLGWAFVGAGRPRWVVMGYVVPEAAVLVGVILLVEGPDDLFAVPLVYAAAQMAGAAIGWIGFRRVWGRLPRRPTRAHIRRLLGDSAPLAGSGLFALLLYNFDLLALGAWVGAAAAGLYGAAYRVINLVSFIVLQYFLALRPAFGRASVEGYASIAGLVDRSIRITMGFAAGLAVGGAVVAEPLLAFLFGDAYAGAADALRWLLAAVALLAISRHHRTLLVAFGHARVDLAAMAAAAAINVALNLALIPRYGLEGAAFATFVAEVAILAIVARELARRVAPARILPNLPRVALAAAATGVAVWAAEPLHVLARVALGGIVHVGALAIVGVVHRRDLAEFLARREAR